MVAIGYMLLHESDDGPASDEPEYWDQRKVMLRMARRLGDSLGRIPCDRAVAARQGLAKRTCLAEVLSLVRQYRRKTVIICGGDKLALSEIERALLMQLFSKLSVEVWDASSGENLTTDVGRWKRIVVDSDQNERRAAAQAIMQLKKIATRLCNKKKLGRKPYGQTVEERKTLEKIWALRRKSRSRRERLSYHRIADKLNDEDIKPRKGKKWYPKTVQDIIRRTKPHLDRP